MVGVWFIAMVDLLNDSNFSAKVSSQNGHVLLKQTVHQPLGCKYTYQEFTCQLNVNGGSVSIQRSKMHAGEKEQR